MKTFKQFLLKEAWNTRNDLPSGGVNAPTRYNNPGGAYPSEKFEKFGLMSYGIIGGGHKIGQYPTPAHGVASNMYQLRNMPIVGKTVGEARNYWVNGRLGGFMELPGMDNKEIITAEKLADQNWLAKWMIATAHAEGYQKPLDRSVFDEAFKLLDSQSTYDPSKIPSYPGTVSGDNNTKAAGQSTPKEPEYNNPGEAAAGLLQGADMLKKAMHGGF